MYVRVYGVRVAPEVGNAPSNAPHTPAHINSQQSHNLGAQQTHIHGADNPPKHSWTNQALGRPVDTVSWGITNALVVVGSSRRGWTARVYRPRLARGGGALSTLDGASLGWRWVGPSAARLLCMSWRSPKETWGDITPGIVANAMVGVRLSTFYGVPTVHKTVGRRGAAANVWPRAGAQYPRWGHGSSIEGPVSTDPTIRGSQCGRTMGHIRGQSHVLRIHGPHHRREGRRAHRTSVQAQHPTFPFGPSIPGWLPVP